MTATRLVGRVAIIEGPRQLGSGSGRRRHLGGLFAGTYSSGRGGLVSDLVVGGHARPLRRQFASALCVGGPTGRPVIGEILHVSNDVRFAIMKATVPPEVENAIAEIARRHGLSREAVLALLFALHAGGGTMAQFSIPELGGSGQWMQGGMTMVGGNMFDNALRRASMRCAASWPNCLPPPRCFPLDVHLGQLVAGQPRRSERGGRPEQCALRNLPEYPAAGDPDQRCHKGF
jgi:hypothetical protein